MSNEKFGKYEIRGTLGEGAMGRVLDAFDSVIERRAALKVVRCPAAGDADGTEAMARFRREAQAAGRLNHPNIVAVYDYGEDDRHAWIAMEHVPGGSLKEMLERDERLAMPAILKIMEQMLSALDYSHKRGVVHRDIKPANIMLGAEGEVKIADFGIARIENSSMTQVGTIMGTPSYMAPEQLRGETVDSRADIWAAGVVLYQLVTGEKPFSGGYSSVQHKAINTEPTPPSTLSVTAPLGIDAVVARAMAKRPDGRFATAGEFAKALQDAMAAPAAALPMADGDATIVATASGTKPAAPAKSPVPARKGAPLVLIGGGVTLLAAAGAALFFLGGQPTQPMAIPPRDVAVNTPARSNPPSVSLTPSLNTTSTPPTQSDARPPQPVLAPPPSRPSAEPPQTPPIQLSPALSLPDFTAAAATLATAPLCGLFNATALPNSVAVDGVLRHADHDALRRLLAARDIPPNAARLSLQGFDGPYCPALEALRPVLAGIGQSPRISLVGTMPLLAEQLLRLDVTMPEWPAQLHIAYFMQSGEVANLLPSAAHPPGSTVRLGEPRAGFPGWEVSEPFGTDLLVAVVSEGPLFGAPRPEVEAQSSYVFALNAAIGEAKRAGRRVLIRPFVVETAAR
ncbi:protein kinase domain-containing protein [Rhodovarius sp.]|uniref:serine/threonine-protein kinase n=1 Tax=Rhodovarius sp. TaxID=2972673 RepID=UPI0034A44595